MNTLSTTTLRPGLLVSLKTTVRGNVHYERNTIESNHRTAAGEERAAWETTRTIADPEEHERATKVRGKCRSLITSVCSASAFGLLCRADNAQALADAVKEARQIAADFNATSRLSLVSVNIITGRIAQDDADAVRAINAEVRDLLRDMEQGVANLDVKQIRDAANKARELGQMLTEGAADKVQIAIDAARKAARQITKAGDAAGQEIDRLTINRIASQRTAFLDMDPAEDVAVPVADARTVDFDPADEPAPVAAPADPGRDMDFAPVEEKREVVTDPDAIA